MKNKKQKANKTKIAQVKYQALKLREKKQIPYYLTKLITDLTGDESAEYVIWLVNMSEHYLRIKGYYKKYPEAEAECEKQLKESKLNLGY